MSMIYSSGDPLENKGKLSLQSIIGALLALPVSGLHLPAVCFNHCNPLLASPACRSENGMGGVLGAAVPPGAALPAA